MELGDRRGEHNARANLAWMLFEQRRYTQFLSPMHPIMVFYLDTKAYRDAAVTQRASARPLWPCGRSRRPPVGCTEVCPPDLRLDAAMTLNSPASCIGTCTINVAADAFIRAVAASDRCGADTRASLRPPRSRDARRHARCERARPGTLDIGRSRLRTLRCARRGTGEIAARPGDPVDRKRPPTPQPAPAHTPGRPAIPISKATPAGSTIGARPASATTAAHKKTGARNRLLIWLLGRIEQPKLGNTQCHANATMVSGRHAPRWQVPPAQEG